MLILKGESEVPVTFSEGSESANQQIEVAAKMSRCTVFSLALDILNVICT